MQTLVGPTRNNECGGCDLGKIRRFGAPEIVEQWVLFGLGFEILYLSFAGAPSVPEGRPKMGVRDAAVGCNLTIAVGPAFPWINGSEMWRIEFGDAPLQLCQVGDAR